MSLVLVLFSFQLFASCFAEHFIPIVSLDVDLTCTFSEELQNGLTEEHELTLHSLKLKKTVVEVASHTKLPYMM